MFYQILIASLIGSVAAMAGGFFLLYREAWAKKVSLLLVSFAAGTLLGAAFFELIPEVMESPAGESVLLWVVAGIMIIFIFEKFLKWYHCHNREVCDYHTFSGTVLFGDAAHNFIDGIAIALSFSVSVELGIATTMAVFFHEVPQEIGDFGVLLHAGYSKAKVFFYNLLTAAATPVGAIIAYFLTPTVSDLIWYFLAFAAGTFIYISASDLMPEVRHKARAKEFIHIFLVLVGIAVIWGLGLLIPE
jgi:zinc and cadmium transporter